MIVRGYSTSGEVPPSGELEEDLAWDGEEDEEDVVLAENEDDEQREMDNVVGVLQELLLDEGFVAMQDHFFHKHAGSFADELEGGGKENKLCYMDIFQQYVQHTESYMEGYLQQHLKQDWSVGQVAAAVLKTQQQQHDGCDEGGCEVLEVLLSLSDFVHFKDNMIAYLKGTQAAASATTTSATSASASASAKGGAHSCTNTTTTECKVVESGEGKEERPQHNSTSSHSETRTGTRPIAPSASAHGNTHQDDKPYPYTPLHYTHT